EDEPRRLQRRAAVGFFLRGEEEYRQPEQVLQCAGAEQQERGGEHERSWKLVEDVAETGRLRVRKAPGEKRPRAEVERIVIVAAGARNVRVDDRVDHEKRDRDREPC